MKWGYVKVCFLYLFLSFDIGLGGALGFIFFVLSVLCLRRALWLYKVVLPVFFVSISSLSLFLSSFLVCYIGCFSFLYRSLFPLSRVIGSGTTWFIGRF